MPSFEKANILDVGAPFFYQVCQSNKGMYTKVIPRELKPDEKPGEIAPETSELLERIEKAESIKWSLIPTQNL